MNKLQLIDDFRQVLHGYHMSDDAVETLHKSHVVMLIGPTSAGRNTIINELVATGDYYYIVSDTTRKPRVNDGVLEQTGREYWFRTEEELLNDLRAGSFLEAAIIHQQQVSGMSIREFAKASEQGKIAISEIEIAGGASVHAAKPDAQLIFVVPPSFDEWMTRMRVRGELPQDETKRRLESAVKEITQALEVSYYHFVVNDTYKHAARDIHALSGAQSMPDDSQARAVARQLLADTQAHLTTL